jgi:microcystin-dependent protein
MEPVLAEIRLFAGYFAPRQWAFCQGQLLSIASNQALFSLLGTIYGGDGRTTFGLPDLRGRTAIHAGNGPGLSDRSLGVKGGTETNTISVTQLASHNHPGTMHVSSSNTTSDSPTNNFLAPLSGRVLSSPPAGAQLTGYGTAASGSMSNASVVVGNIGGNQPVNNMQPFLVLNYIIATQGLFPSRS